MAKQNKSLIWDAMLKQYKNVFKDYFANPDSYVRTYIVQINGKVRHIITYDGEKGNQLRHFQNEFIKFVNPAYISSPSSHAYKEGHSIMTCVKQHMNNIAFLKSDIHSYFDSIDFTILFNRLLKIRFFAERKNDLRKCLKACFYNNHLPIGFVSSPILSDIYLTDIDKKYSRSKKYTYTRYADDFIISTNDDNYEKIFEGVKDNLIKDLHTLKLELNDKKTYVRKLNQKGDAIHVLGVNIVRQTKNRNKITISDKTIRQISKDFCKLVNKKRISNDNFNKEFDRLYGQMQFVKLCSQSSKKKLEKMLSIKLNKPVRIDANELRKLSVKYCPNSSSR